MTSPRKQTAHLVLAVLAPLALAGCAEVAVAADEALGRAAGNAKSVVVDERRIGSTCVDVFDRQDSPADRALAAITHIAADPYVAEEDKKTGLALRMADESTADLRAVSADAESRTVAGFIDMHADAVEDVAADFRAGDTPDTDRARRTGQRLLGICEPYIERIRD